MLYDTKLILHIPCKAWDNGLTDVDYSAFKRILAERLAEIGVTSFYTVAALGCYKGREYDEILLTVFCEKRKRNDVIAIFRDVFQKHNDIMKQEALAYECDGALTVENIVS